MFRALFRTWLAGLSAWLLLPSEIRAEPPVLTLPGLLSEVEAHSPLLQSRRAAEAAAKTHARQAASVDDPMLMVELWQAPTSIERLPLMVTLKQALPWPGKLVARAQVARFDEARAQADTQLQKQQLRLATVRAYALYLFSHRSLAVKEENQKILQVIVASVDGRYRVGRAELAELLDAQAALHEQNTELIELGHRSKQAESDILALLGETSPRGLGVPVSIPELVPLPSLDSLLEQATQNRPELRMAQLATQQEEAKVTQARSEQAPDFALWGSYMVPLRSDMERTFTVGIQTSIPSFSLFKTKAAQQEAESLRTQNKQQELQLRASVLSEVRASYTRCETVLRHLGLHHDDLIPLSERAVQTARAGYQSGRVPLSLLLSATQRLLQQRLDYERYLAELMLRRAELDFSVGQGVSP